MKNLGEELASTMQQRGWGLKYRELMKNALHDPDVQSFLKTNQDKLDATIIKSPSSLASIYEYVQARRNIDQLASGYQPRLIMANQQIQVTYEPNQQLIAQQRQAELERKFMALDMSSGIRQASLDDYAKGASSRQESYMAAINFTLQYTQNPQQFVPGLYLSGTLGVGKTYLLAAIARQLVEHNVTVLLMHFPTFAVQMKNAIHDNSVLDRIDSIKAVPIVMLDDIGADSMSSWIRDEVLSVILQYRMQEKLPTFFSSNLSMEDLQLHMTVNQRGDYEPLKAARIMERIKYLSREIVVSGPNLRQQTS